MHSRVTGQVLASALFAVVLVAGCSSDPAPDGESSSPTSDSAPTTSAPTTGPTEPSSPTTTAAAGPEIQVEDLGTPVLGLQLPGDLAWRLSPDGEGASAKLADGGFVDFDASTVGALPGKSLGFYARTIGESAGSDPELERLDDRTVAGVDCFVLEASDDSGLFSLVGGVYGETLVYFSFTFPRDDAAAREVVESVLASVEPVER